MKKIALCPNPYRDTGLSLTMKVFRLLEEYGLEIVVCPVFDTGSVKDMPIVVAVADLGSQLDGTDMLITFGGDGTMLHCARAAAPGGIPILGVNVGTKGFMTELEPQEIDAIRKIPEGAYSIDRRMMLDISVIRGGRALYTDFALNEAAVSGAARMIRMSVYGDGRKISGFSGDGVIVSTPTGSTAYSMSAGGPIVEPAAENIIITPICPHAFMPKSFVLTKDRAVTVEIGHLEKKSCYLTVDGGSQWELNSGDLIDVRKAGYETRLVKVMDRSFYDIVNEKLGD